MSNIIPKEKVKGFKEKLTDYYLYEIYQNQFAVSDLIRRLRTIQTDKEFITRMDDINNRLKQAVEAKQAASKVDASKKKYAEKKAAFDAHAKAEGEVEKIKLEKSRQIQPLNDLYKEISHYAEKVEECKKSYEFAVAYDHTAVVEQLPYAELDGTKYVMENNILKKNNFGQMVLLVEPKKDDENNNSETASKTESGD